MLESIPNTDAPALEAPPVCMRTLTRSRGWPTRTQHAPPTPPEMKDLRAVLPSFGSSCWADFGESGVVGFGSILNVMV